MNQLAKTESSSPSIIRRQLKWVTLQTLRGLYGWGTEVNSTRFRYIFILGHQRTGSSLLTQIICSHPEVAGFGETHTPYRSRGDLRRLRGEVFRIHGRFLRWESRVLDKVLFNNLLPDPQIVDAPDIRWIFMLRDPVRTMRSMVDMFGNEGRQVQYYLERVEWLRSAAVRLGSEKRSFFTTYDRLIRDAPEELSALSKFLDLSPPLRQEYELQPRAGMEGVGDSSERIKSGKIIVKQREHSYHPRKFIAESIRHEYERALFTLSHHCECTQGTRDLADIYSSEETEANQYGS